MEKDLKKVKQIGTSDLVQMIRLGVENLNAHLDEVNDLNVFPVPDGDTGTNMKRTIATGYGNIKDLTDETPIFECGQLLSKGMLLGARGNSGVILSQIFRGFSNGLGKKKTISVAGLSIAFKSAVKQAYGAVVKPVEGTILTVLREAVQKANKTLNVTCLQYFQNLLEQGRITLEQTPEMLDVLKEANVVDSGGAGLCYIFEGFLAYFQGIEPNPEYKNVTVEEEEAMNHKDAAQELDFSLFNEFSELDYGYCTEFILQLSASKVPDVYNFDEQEVINYLNGVGNSIVCFKDGTIIKTHVHTKDPGAVLSYVRRWGEFLTIKVENMALQHNNKIQKELDKEKPNLKKKPKVHKAIASVAVAQGKGLIEAFDQLGIDQIVDGKQTSNPSAEDFLKAFNEIDADNIVVLPNNSNIVLTAEQAKDMYKETNPNVNVVVIKTKSIAQGYVAANFMQFADDDINQVIQDINGVIADVSSLEITTATRDTKVSGVEVTKDHYIGILNHDLVACDKMRNACTISAISKIEDITDKESCLIIFGKSITTNTERESIISEIKSKYPNVEVTSIDGGQDVYDYIIAVC